MCVIFLRTLDGIALVGTLALGCIWKPFRMDEVEQHPIFSAMRQLTQQDLQWVVCPACHATLQLAEASVVCVGCGRRYPVMDGLPVLLISRAL